jgi:hypothetical protein
MTSFVHLTRQFPSMNSEKGWVHAIQMQVDNFSVMEIRPVSEPIMQLLSTCYRVQSIRQTHLHVLHPAAVCHASVVRINRLVLDEKNFCSQNWQKIA